MRERFTLVGIRPQPPLPPVEEGPPAWRGALLPLMVLGAVVLGCLLLPLLLSGDPAHMDLAHCNVPPCRAFFFGTDAMGRDIFAMIWSGGRLSLSIGAGAAAVSTGFAILFGAASGCAPKWLDALLMRLAELLLSVPSLLLVVLLQAVLGGASPLSLSLVIGLTGWTTMAKVVRTQVRQLRDSEYILASRCMGGGFFHILRRHLAPGFVSPVMFMAVMNVRSAIAAESTLSFMGMGLPLETPTWGSMLSLAERALLTGAWWVILIPGGFLVVTLLALTGVGNALRQAVNRKESNL